jgi:hypothetical protein
MGKYPVKLFILAIGLLVGIEIGNIITGYAAHSSWVPGPIRSYYLKSYNR